MSLGSCFHSPLACQHILVCVNIKGPALYHLHMCSPAWAQLHVKQAQGRGADKEHLRHPPSHPTHFMGGCISDHQH